MIFNKDHFSIQKTPQYPPFFRVIQSVYSPILGNTSPYDSDKETAYTAILSLGLWKTDTKEQGISICAVLQKKIMDPMELIKRLKLMKKDYLNKTLSNSEFIRPADELIIERRKSDKGPFALYGEVDNFAFFYPEYHGGDTLNNRLTLAIPLFKKIHLAELPDDEGLRAEDKYLLSMIRSFPSAESYPLVSALSQGVLYVQRRWFK